MGRFLPFLRDERGAVSVDWTVLSASAVGLAVATTALMTDSIDQISSRMDGELRNRVLNDAYIELTTAHFEGVIEANVITEADAADLFELANAMMNYHIVAELDAGMTLLADGQLGDDDLAELVAIASVAWQRNVMDDALLDEMFGFGGSDPAYLTIAGGPDASRANRPGFAGWSEPQS